MDIPECPGIQKQTGFWLVHPNINLRSGWNLSALPSGQACLRARTGRRKHPVHPDLPGEVLTKLGQSCQESISQDIFFALCLAPLILRHIAWNLYQF